MRVISAGLTFTDIDGFGAGIAYAELLRLQGTEAIPVFTSPLNESICDTVRSWPAEYLTDYKPAASDTFTVVDNSDPQYLDSVVEIARVDEVIDHHVGFEEFWQRQGTPNVDIEFIGAACTMIYERWQRAGLTGRMSQTSARLLVCGILDNTLNFGADITTDRDRAAYEELQKIADLPEDWPARYFLECEQSIVADVAAAVTKDTKVLNFKTFTEPLHVGQIAVWDGARLVRELLPDLLQALAGRGGRGFIHLIGLSERRSYFIASDADVRNWLGELLEVRFMDDIAEADRLWLRKEIVKEDIVHGQR